MLMRTGNHAAALEVWEELRQSAVGLRAHAIREQIVHCHIILGHTRQALAEAALLTRDFQQSPVAVSLAGYALRCDGLEREARIVLEAGLSRFPSSQPLANMLAFQLATCPESHLRDGRRAIFLAEKACTAMAGSRFT